MILASTSSIVRVTGNSHGQIYGLSSDSKDNFFRLEPKPNTTDTWQWVKGDMTGASTDRMYIAESTCLPDEKFVYSINNFEWNDGYKNHSIYNVDQNTWASYNKGDPLLKMEEYYTSMSVGYFDYGTAPYQYHIIVFASPREKQDDPYIYCRIQLGSGNGIDSMSCAFSSKKSDYYKVNGLVISVKYMDYSCNGKSWALMENDDVVYSGNPFGFQNEGDGQWFKVDSPGLSFKKIASGSDKVWALGAENRKIYYRKSPPDLSESWTVLDGILADDIKVNGDGSLYAIEHCLCKGCGEDCLATSVCDGFEQENCKCVSCPDGEFDATFSNTSLADPTCTKCKHCPRGTYYNGCGMQFEEVKCTIQHDGEYSDCHECSKNDNVFGKQFLINECTKNTNVKCSCFGDEYRNAHGNCVKGTLFDRNTDVYQVRPHNAESDAIYKNRTKCKNGLVRADTLSLNINHMQRDSICVEQSYLDNLQCDYGKWLNTKTGKCEDCTECFEQDISGAGLLVTLPTHTEVQACSATADTVCKKCTRCEDIGSNMYTFQMCSLTEDTICRQKRCQKCEGSNKYVVSDCDDNRGEQVCAECTVCKSTELTVSQCNSTHDTICIIKPDICPDTPSNSGTPSTPSSSSSPTSTSSPDANVGTNRGSSNELRVTVVSTVLPILISVIYLLC